MKRDIPETSLNPFDRIKDALNEWAGFMRDRQSGGYPRASNFANERVQSSNTTDAYYENVPDRVIMLDRAIESLAPMFKLIMHMEYMDRRSKAIKAAVIGISHQIYGQRLSFMYEQLSFQMFKDNC